MNYSYDNDGRLASVIAGGTTTTYTFDAAGRPATVTFPAGSTLTQAYLYDRAGRVTSVTNKRGTTTLSQFAYTLDGVGNPTHVVTVDGTVAYSYDELHRLTEACFEPPCAGAPGEDRISWTYDPVGNRLTETRPTGATTYTYNASDQLTAAVGLSGSLVYTYDPNGNQTQAGPRGVSYDLENRVSSMTELGTTTTYNYDGDGTRLRATRGSQVTNYLWDANAALPLLALERDSSGAPLRRYTYGHQLLSMHSGGQDSYYLTDALGSVVNVASPTGSLQWTYTYEPFGTARSIQQGDAGAPANLMRFTGQLLDSESGLYHLRARQYDSVIGRFVQTDPVAAQRDMPYISAYSYVNDRPTTMIDPSGMIPEGKGVLGELWASYRLGSALTPNWLEGAGWAMIVVGGGGLICYHAFGSCISRAASVGGGGGATQAAYEYATRAQKLEHIFAARHNFAPLIQQFGSREAVVRQILDSIRGLTPTSGVFEITVTIGGQNVVVRGAVVDGIVKLGTAFSP